MKNERSATASSLKPRGRRRRSSTLAGVCLTMIGLAAMAASVKISAPAERASSGSSRPELVVVRLDHMPRADGTRDRLELLDPTPLFMPAGERGLGANPDFLGKQSGGAVGKVFQPEMSFLERGAGRTVLLPAAPGSAVKAMEVVTEIRSFEGLSRAESPLVKPRLKARAARLEVYPSDDTTPGIVMDLDQLPGSDSPSWRPMELSLLVTSAGMITRPSIVSGTGLDEADLKIRAYLADELLPKAALRPGIYRILVGP